MCVFLEGNDLFLHKINKLLIKLLLHFILEYYKEKKILKTLLFM